MVKKIVVEYCMVCPYVREVLLTGFWYCTAVEKTLIKGDVETEIDGGCPLQNE